MTTPSLDHLRTFITVQRSGSQTRAAELLSVTQSTVSAHLASLERRLGFALFVRTPTGVVPTAKGAELARQVAPHVDALDDVPLFVRGVLDTPPAVHIGGPAEILSVKVLPHLREITAEVEVPLRFRFGLAEDLLSQLSDRSLDIVVSAVPPRRRGLAAVPAYDEEFVLVASLEWANVPLAEIPLIAYAEDLPIVRRYWRSVFGRRPDDVDVVAVVPDLRGILSAVSGGLGMSVLPRYLVDDELAAGRLLLVHRPEVAPLNTGYLVTRSRELERSTHLAGVSAQLKRRLS